MGERDDSDDVCRPSAYNHIWWRPVHQWETRLLRRLHLLWTYNDPHPGIPRHQAIFSPPVHPVALASFLAALCGVIFLLLARGHYTIDVLLAYYVSSRLWWVYHTLAHNDTLKKAGPHNLLANLCWWPVFRFFETKTSGPLPNRFSLPLPRRLKRWLKSKLCSKNERSRPGLSSVSVQDLAK